MSRQKNLLNKGEVENPQQNITGSGSSPGKDVEEKLFKNTFD